MAEARIPVDIFNPGQVFACLGLAEAVEILLGNAQGAFDWRDEGQPHFILHAADERNPLHVVLDFLEHAEVLACVPEGSPHGKKNPKPKSDKQKIPFKVIPAGAPFPSPDEGADKLPAVLRGRIDGEEREIRIHYWAEATPLTGRDNVKFWAGAGGYPGVALLKDALNLMDGHWDEATLDPFNIAAPQSSSFRLDWRRDYVPLDTGFSLNQHSHIITVGYPLVEILGAIGLSHARPKPKNKLEYVYGIIGRDDDAIYPPMFLRAALGACKLPFPARTFRMMLNWPGQEGQARCITNVIEET
jgi:CRISPR-associated protein Csx14